MKCTGMGSGVAGSEGGDERESVPFCRKSR